MPIYARRGYAGLWMSLVWACLTVAGAAHAQPEEGSGLGVEGDSPSAVPLPDSPAGEQLAWMLAAINGEMTPTLEDVQDHFSADFLAAIAAEDVLASLVGGGLGPMHVVAFERQPTDLDIRAVAQGPGGQSFLIHLTVAGTEGHPILTASTRLSPELDPARDRVESLEEVESAALAIAPNVSVIISEIVDTGLRPIVGVEPDHHALSILTNTVFARFFRPEAHAPLQGGSARGSLRRRRVDGTYRLVRPHRPAGAISRCCTPGSGAEAGCPQGHDAPH